jgi:hypothetical protein
VRRVAGHAAFVRFHRRVFEYEGTHGVGVAFGANRELTGSGSDLMTRLRAVRIVAVATLHQPDIDAVTIGPGELGLLGGVASKAKLGLRFHKHEIYVFGFVWAVARGATDAISEMSGFREVLGFETRLVARGAYGSGLRRRECLKADDFSYIPAAVNVRLTRTMARLATMLLALEQRCMRSIGKVLVPDFLVAGLTDLGVSELAAGVARKRGGCGLRIGLRFAMRCGRPGN